MKAGHEQLKQSYAQMNIADIEKLMDDMADFADESKEIQEAISTAFAVPDGFDEADFENEFAAMEEEMRMESLAGLNQPAAARPAYLDAPAAAPAAAGGYSAADASAPPLPPPSGPPGGGGGGTAEAEAAALLARS